MKLRSLMVLSVAAVCLLATAPAHAVLVDLGPGSFTPAAPVITFSEVPLNTNNPVYNFLALPGLGNVTVSFAGNFLGQVQGGGFPVTLIDNTPSNPLTLDLSSTAFTTMDGSNPSSPVLSGIPTFNGPISVLFSSPVAGVGLEGGWFNGINSTTIEAYDAQGNILGNITNSQLGLEFYGLADSSGQNVISGISFYITGNEPAGFAIDNLTFGAAGQINDLVPEPVTVAGMLLGVSSLIGYVRRRR
jgi:hypothetical protein